MLLKYTKVPKEKGDYLSFWENELKPEILSYQGIIPVSIAAKALGLSIDTVQAQLRSGLYDYGVARPCSGGSYRYEILPLRFIKFVEGDLNSIKQIIFSVDN